MRSCRLLWRFGGADRACMGLAGKTIVEVKVCVKIGYRICSEDCFASGF
jgi:hypothetical protein